ncbi:hypothetical protein Q9966_015768 [Columba livia]|nr:hypothetical protein Q9966_015768 [Columba livia]
MVPFCLASAVKGHATTWGSSLVLEEGSPVLNGDVVRRGGKEFDHSVLDSFLSIVELLASGSTIIRVVKSILVSISLGRKTTFRSSPDLFVTWLLKHYPGTAVMIDEHAPGGIRTGHIFISCPGERPDDMALL